jgi:hypothetical protein
MAGRSLMHDAPGWLELPPCPWLTRLPFFGNVRAFAAAVAANASSSPPCLASYESSIEPAYSAFVRGTGAPPTVAILLRSPLSWALSAAEHFQRAPPCHPPPCRRNTGLEDLVSRGCFWQPGHPEGEPRRCGGNYDFPACVA